MSVTPGTVSEILWHFTGGPRWNEKENRQTDSPKPAADAYKALLGILRTQELRLGEYKEVVKVRFPHLRIWDRKAAKYTVKENVMRVMKSAPVCCLADIPIMHLSYHSDRYGKFAIGFHRAAVVNAGFNPVFYTLHDSAVIRTIRQGFARIRGAEVADVDDWLDNIASEMENADTGVDIDGYITAIREIATETERRIDTAKESIENFLAFVKTFDMNEFRSVYCEREWRSVKSFAFDYADVAMVVMPKTVGSNSYFGRFLSSTVKKRLPASVPVVPFETLLES